MSHWYSRTDRFRAGTGCYTCQSCGKLTRCTGDNGVLGVCPVCYEKGACGNSLSDGGFAEASGLDPWEVLEECKTVKEVLKKYNELCKEYNIVY